MEIGGRGTVGSASAGFEMVYPLSNYAPCARHIPTQSA